MHFWTHNLKYDKTGYYCLFCWAAHCGFWPKFFFGHIFLCQLPSKNYLFCPGWFPHHFDASRPQKISVSCSRPVSFYLCFCHKGENNHHNSTGVELIFILPSEFHESVIIWWLIYWWATIEWQRRWIQNTAWSIASASKPKGLLSCQGKEEKGQSKSNFISEEEACKNKTACMMKESDKAHSISFTRKSLLLVARAFMKVR